MERTAVLVLTGIWLLALSNPTSATTLTFDDLRSYCAQGYAYYNSMPSVYSGLRWTNFYAIDGPRNAAYYYLPAEFGTKALVSGSVAVFNGSGNPASIAAYANKLTLHSAYLTATWYDGMTVEADAYAGGTLVDSKTVTLSAFAPTLVTYEFTNVDSVVWLPSGGTPVPQWTSGSGTNFDIDNLSYDIVVPEPSSALGIILGSVYCALTAGRKGAFRRGCRRSCLCKPAKRAKRNMTLACTAALLLALALGSGNRLFAASYRVRDLGVMGRAVAINASGQIIGVTNDYHGFLWQDGVITDLGIADTHGINDLGQVVGYRSATGHAFLWQNGVFQDLGVVGDKWSVAFDINNSDWIVGYLQPNLQHAFLWRDGLMSDLGTLGGTYSDAKAVNNVGQIVGQSRPADSTFTHAYLWQDGAMQDLGVLGMSGYSCAWDINDLGQVVGESGSAFLWENGVMKNLGALPGQTIAVAYSINNFGQIVGQSNYARAVVWDHGTVQELKTLGGTMGWARAINDSGWIVGSATDSWGNTHAVLWQPVPEPSSLLALLLGIGGLAGGVTARRRL